MNSGENLSLAMARSVARRYTKDMMRWHYEHGLVIQACLAVGETLHLQEFYPWAYGMYDPFVAADGTIATYRQGEYNLDQINAGRNLFLLYEKSGEERFLLAAKNLRKQLDEQPRTLSGVFWHKEIYPWQIWLDGLYMQGPFNAQFAKLSGRGADFDDLANQIQTVYQTLKDPKTGLLYHAYDESRGMRWSDLSTGLSPHVWGRALGWFCMALVDILDFLPPDHPKRESLHAILRSTLGSVLAFQDGSGLWYQVIDKPEVGGNYLEASCTSMFCYVLFKAVRVGIVVDARQKESFLKQARLALKGLKETYLRQDDQGSLHLGGICSVAGLGGNPFRDGSFPYYISEAVVEDDFKGVGAFILAALEAEHAEKG